MTGRRVIPRLTASIGRPSAFIPQRSALIPPFSAFSRPRPGSEGSLPPLQLRSRRRHSALVVHKDPHLERIGMAGLKIQKAR